MSKKILISLDKSALHRLAVHAKNQLLSNPLLFEVIEFEENASTAWRMALFLNFVLEGIIQEYFIGLYDQGTIDMDDLPEGINISDMDIIRVEEILNNNPLLPLKFEIFTTVDYPNQLFYKCNYTQIIEPETTKNSSN